MRAYCVAGWVLALMLSNPLRADVQYGIEVEQRDLVFMMGKHGAATDFELGRAGPVHLGRALKLYRQAAVLGYPLAQSSLGRLYETGRGVPQDNVLAYMWYELAAASGDEIAVASREAAAARLDPAGIRQAQAMARELRRHLP